MCGEGNAFIGCLETICHYKDQNVRALVRKFRGGGYLYLKALYVGF